MRKAIGILAVLLITAATLITPVTAMYQRPGPHQLAADAVLVNTIMWYAPMGSRPETQADWNAFLGTNSVNSNTNPSQQNRRNPVREGDLNQVFYYNADGNNWRIDPGGDWLWNERMGVVSMPTSHTDKSAETFYSITFEGTQIQLFGIPGHNQGMAAISINGGPAENVDFFSERFYFDGIEAYYYTEPQLLYTSPALPYGRHTIRVQRTNTVTGDAAGNSVTVGQNRSAISFSFANVYAVPNTRSGEIDPPETPERDRQSANSAPPTSGPLTTAVALLSLSLFLSALSVSSVRGIIAARKK